MRKRDAFQVPPQPLHSSRVLVATEQEHRFVERQELLRPPEQSQIRLADAVILGEEAASDPIVAIGHEKQWIQTKPPKRLTAGPSGRAVGGNKRRKIHINKLALLEQDVPGMPILQAQTM